MGGGGDDELMASFGEEFAGGTVGGVLGISVVYPLDTVKLRYACYAKKGGDCTHATGHDLYHLHTLNYTR